MNSKRLSFMVIQVTIVILLGLLVVGCGDGVKNAVKTKVLSSASKNVSLTPLTTDDGQIVTPENFNPEDFGYKKFSDLSGAQKEAGFSAKEPDKAMSGDVKAVYVGTSRAGTRELTCYYVGGFAVTQWPGEPVDYEAMLESIRQENVDRARAIASDPAIKDLQGDNSSPITAQVPSVILIGDKKVGAWSNPDGSIYLLEWSASGQVFQLGSFAKNLSNDQKVQIAKSIQ